MIVNLKNAYHYKWGKNCDGWVFTARDDLLIIEERMPAGTAEHRHLHVRARQFIQVTQGQLTIEVEGNTFVLNAGDSLEIEPGQMHQVRNDSDADVRFNNVSTPSAHGDRVNDETS
jgi:quercetin dioxygenase-like cupin family protein